MNQRDREKMLNQLAILRESPQFAALVQWMEHEIGDSMDELTIEDNMADVYRLQGRVDAFRCIIRTFADLDSLREAAEQARESH
jgi:hypothetical protein